MVIAKGRVLVAHLLQADADDVTFAHGRLTVGGGERSIDLLDLAASSRDPANLPDGMKPGLDADASVVDIEDFLRATSQIAQTTLRSVLGKADLDSLLS